MNDVHHHLNDLVITHNARAVVIYEGDNDVAQGVPVETILESYRAVINDLQDAQPKLRIYLVSVKPSIFRLSMWPTMPEVNSRLQELSENNGQVIYIDVASSLLTEAGTPKPDIFVTDNLHLNQKKGMTFGEMLFGQFNLADMYASGKGTRVEFAASSSLARSVMSNSMGSICDSESRFSGILPECCYAEIAAFIVDSVTALRSSPQGSGISIGCSIPAST